MRFAPRFSLLLAVLIACALFPAAAFADPPTADMPPMIMESSPQVGVELSFEPGMWNQSIYANSAQWVRCTDSTELESCSDIEGASESTYTPTGSDRGMFLAVREIVENEFEEGNSETSNRVGPVIWAPEVIDNGVMALGVRPQGSLNADSQVMSHDENLTFGLRLLDGQYDAISPGSPAEGWGLADGDSQVSGWANRNEDEPGPDQENAHIISYTNDSVEATSVSEIWDEEEAPYARVTQDFSPSSVSDYLYEIDTTIEPLQLAGMTDARYRRLVDWDIEPTPYDEVVSTVVGNSPNLAVATDDGFSSTNPLKALDVVTESGQTFSNGPGDIGAAFDFHFGAIPYGSSKQFKVFYGAAPTRAALLNALDAADVEAFSIARNSTAEGASTGGPAIFALGFADIGGDPVIDTTEPVAEITSMPAAITDSTEASFEFAAEDPTATFECRLDDGTWAACSSPASYTELAPESSHKLLVRAMKDEKTQLLPASFNWRITDRPFDLYFNTVPDWWGTNTDAYFGLSADDIDVEELSIECSLDGAEFDACSTSESLIGLDEGAHTFTYRATKNGASEAVTYNWTISGAIMSRFVNKPREFSDSLSPYFAWETAGPVTGVDCKLDAGEWQPCDSGGDVSLDLFPGEHTYSIRAHDGDEGVQTPITSWTWTIDTKDPAISHDIPQVLASMPFTATLTSDEPLDSLRCSIDDHSSKDCSGGLVLDGLDDGWHEVQYGAEDLAGNETDDSYEFYVDSGASVATITSKPPRWTESRAAKFEFTGESGATFECQLDGDDFEPCTSPAKYDLLGSDDVHYFEVRATKNGRTQAEPSYYRWTITDEPFSLYFDDAPGKLSTDTTPYFDVDADAYNEDLLDYTCTLDDGAPFTCAQDFTLPEQSLGEHKLTLVGSADGATEELSWEWRIHDDSAMIVVLTGTPQKFSADSSPTFHWEGVGPIDDVQCRLDAGAWGACDEGGQHSLEFLSEGEHLFEVRPLDSGESAGTGDSYIWTVDTTAPEVNKSAVPASFSLPYQLPLTANEEIKSTECALDGDYRGNCGWPLKLTYLPPGAHTIEFFAFDLAGNATDGPPLAIEFNVGAPTTPTTPTGEAPPKVTPPAAPAKPVLTFKKPKAKAKKLALTVTCPIAKCTVSGWVKVGKKKYKLKSKSAMSGKSNVTLNFDKKLAKATKKAKKGKTSFSLSVVGGGATTTKTGKF